jgi:hypothetical protein
LLVLLSLCLGYQPVLHGCPFLNCILLHRAASYDICVSLNTTRCPDCKKKTTAQIPEDDSQCGRPHQTSSVVCKHTRNRLGDFAFIHSHAACSSPGTSCLAAGLTWRLVSSWWKSRSHSFPAEAQRPGLISIPCEKTHQHVAPTVALASVLSVLLQTLSRTCRCEVECPLPSRLHGYTADSAWNGRAFPCLASLLRGLTT